MCVTFPKEKHAKGYTLPTQRCFGTFRNPITLDSCRLIVAEGSARWSKTSFILNVCDIISDYNTYSNWNAREPVNAVALNGLHPL